MSLPLGVPRLHLRGKGHSLRQRDRPVLRIPAGSQSGENLGEGWTLSLEWQPHQALRAWLLGPLSPRATLPPHRTSIGLAQIIIFKS